MDETIETVEVGESAGDELIPAREIARRLGVSHTTMRRIVDEADANRLGPWIDVSCGRGERARFVIRRRDWDAWLDSRTVARLGGRA